MKRLVFFAFAMFVAFLAIGVLAHATGPPASVMAGTESFYLDSTITNTDAIMGAGLTTKAAESKALTTSNNSAPSDATISKTGIALAHDCRAPITREAIALVHCATRPSAPLITMTADYFALDTDRTACIATTDAVFRGTFLPGAGLPYRA